MPATEPYYPEWELAAKEIKERSDGKMDANTESSLENLIAMQKVLKASTVQMQNMLENMEIDGDRAYSNAHGANLPGPVLALDDVGTCHSLAKSLAELEELAKNVQAVYESFNAADRQRKKRKAEEVSQEQSKKNKTED